MTSYTITETQSLPYRPNIQLKPSRCVHDVFVAYHLVCLDCKWVRIEKPPAVIAKPPHQNVISHHYI